MTLFDRNQLPQQIDRVEELVAWGTTVLNDLYPDVTVIESPGSATRRANSSPFPVVNGSTTSWIMINRLTLDLAPTWRRQGKLWLAVQPLGQLTIPPEFYQV